jgi:hypothetical protein
MRFDQNEILVVDGGTPATLNLQTNGGNVLIGDQSPVGVFSVQATAATVNGSPILTGADGIEAFCWADIDLDTSPAIVAQSGCVDAVTRLAPGSYDVDFDPPWAGNSAYGCVATANEIDTIAFLVKTGGDDITLNVTTAAGSLVDGRTVHLLCQGRR